MRQHINKFNKFRLTESENLNISDVMNNVLYELNIELDDINNIINKMKYNDENWYFAKGKIKGIESSIKIVENMLKHYS